jgi:hypothetical protein
MALANGIQCRVVCLLVADQGTVSFDYDAIILAVVYNLSLLGERVQLCPVSTCQMI